MTEDEEVRDVYAHFGLAMFMGQVLEHGLVNALVIARLPERTRVTRAQIDSFMDRQFEQPLGRLISDIRRHVGVPELLEGRLREALLTRNWLAHSYFRERAVTFATSKGRRRMVAELDRARDLLEGAVAAVNELVRPIREGFGITDELIEGQMQRLKQSVKEDG